MPNCVLILQGSALTITSLETVKVELGQTADVRWNLSEPFDPSVLGSRFEVYRGYISESDNILVYIGGSSPFCAPIAANVSCIVDGYQVGFNITNIQPNNASRYSISVMTEPFGPTEGTNEDAVLYVYGKWQYLQYLRVP